MIITTTITNGTSTATGETIYRPCQGTDTVSVSITVTLQAFQTYTFMVIATVGTPVTYDLGGSTGTFTANTYSTVNLPPGETTITFSRTGADLTVYGIPTDDAGMSTFKVKQDDGLLP